MVYVNSITFMSTIELLTNYANLRTKRRGSEHTIFNSVFRSVFTESVSILLQNTVPIRTRTKTKISYGKIWKQFVIRNFLTKNRHTFILKPLQWRAQHEIPSYFLFWCQFCPAWVRIRIPNQDPDLLTQLSPDPIRIWIWNTEYSGHPQCFGSVFIWYRSFIFGWIRIHGFEFWWPKISK